MTWGIFVLAMFFSSSFKRFSFTFSFSTMGHILLARENGIFVKQCREWFDVHETYWGHIVLSMLVCCKYPCMYIEIYDDFFISVVCKMK